MKFFWQKPKCELEVKQGTKGFWRWTARSPIVQEVDGFNYHIGTIIALDTVAGRLTANFADQAGRVAMRGWKVTKAK